MLVIGGLDLVKSWRESVHPRDTFGKFSAVRGGSKIVTKAGKTGVVQSSDATHHKVRFEDGKLGKVKKDDALHANDHAKVEDAKKKAVAKAKRDAKAAEKAKATKTANKTNANGKTGAGKAVVDPTEKPKSTKPVSKLKRDMEAPVMKRNTTHDETSRVQEVKVAIPQTKKPVKDGDKTNEQNVAGQDLKDAEKEPSAAKVTINSMWNSPAVNKLMALPPEKRNAEDIRKVAGDIASANTKLSGQLVRTMTKARGMHVLNLTKFQRNAGEKKRSKDWKASLGSGAKNSKEAIERGESATVTQASGVYGDLMQAANSSMYQTLHSVLSGSQNPKQGTDIGAHVITRMKQDLHRDIYEVMNDLPAPHEIRQAIGDVSKHEAQLTTKLGRTPNHDELADHLANHSKHFNDAPIVRAPYWDDEKQEWHQTNKRYEAPSDKLRALKTYAAQQKATSIDAKVGEADGERSTVKDVMTDRNQASPEQGHIERERQAELKDALPKAMRSMGLSDDEIKVMSVTHSQGSETGSKAHLTADETSKRLKEDHGIDINPKKVAYLLSTAKAKVGEALAQKHPAIEQLLMLKSIIANAVLKSAYEFDLVKSLQGWGVDLSVMNQVYSRTLYADSKDDLLKSMAPHEYVGSFVTLDEGDVIAHLVEFTLPDDNNLYKSFNAFHTGLKKSMFPHKGGNNHAVNEKAKAYIKANGKKYSALSDSQHSAAKAKGSKGHTWSEELLLKHAGSAWITWGGKRILVNASTGDVLYDSANDAHREDHNSGAQADKIEFHHEKEGLAAHEEAREASTSEAWKNHIASKEKNAGKKDGTFDYGTERDKFAKNNRGVSFDEKGNMQFKRDEEVNEDNAHHLDHGIQAFRDDMDSMRTGWKQKAGGKVVGGVVRNHLDTNGHKALDIYADPNSDEDVRKHLDSLGSDKAAKREYLGKHFLEKEGVKEALTAYHNAYKSGNNPSEAEAKAREVMAGIGSVAGRNKDHMTTFLKDVAKMSPAHDGNLDDLAMSLGTKELSRGEEETGKNLLPEGKYMIGNPITGKTLVIEVGGAYTGGAGSRKKDADGNDEKGKYTSEVLEAFDPDGGTHEELNKWGNLGRALGYTGKDASNLKSILTQFANTDSDKPFMKPISDEEFAKHRAKTAAGLQDSMLHKEFKLVDQQRDKDGAIKGQTFAQKMPDGTTNHLTVNKDGMITDPLMQRLLNQRKPVTNEKELNELLKGAVGNRRWVTAHFGGDVHIGDALGHHIQLEYDGKGAPRVVGGKYDGYRYIDKADVPKGSIDPATGEPVQALFKNGKLVDRRFSTQNDVAMKEGNAVMYPAGGGKFRKGRIHSIQDGTFKVTDGNGHVVGMFKKGDLQAAKEEGRILSNSGQAVVKLAKNGAHRMNVNEAFAGEKPKAKELFEAALRKAKVNKAFDDEGNLKPDLELSDAMHRNLSKVLGRSKAGKAMLRKFDSSFTNELEAHVPESLRAQVEAEGVRVMANGTARISAGKFEQLRSALGGLSMTNEANEHMKDHFARKDRKPKTSEELKANYQPATVKTKNPAFDAHYKAQFNPNSYLMNPSQGLYGTQLEGASHLVERGRGIAGHGINRTLAMTFAA